MSDEPREHRDPEAAPGGDEAAAGAAGGPPEGPPPATWAGRRRAEQPDEGTGKPDDSASPEPEQPDEAQLDEEQPDEGVGEPGDDADPDARADEPAATAEHDALGADEAERVPEAHEEPEDREGGTEAEPPDDVTTQDTVEADSLELADRAAAEEAAHAALRARAAESATRRGLTPPPQPPTPQPQPTAGEPAAAQATDTPDSGEAPKRGLWLRFVAASLVIIASMATATAVSFLLFLSDIAQGLDDDDAFNSLQPELAAVEGGDPQTILILGSDKYGTPGDPGRSDTTMLLRVDPEKNFLALLSLPRDLRVEIPGYGTDRLNAAYSYGEQDNVKGGGPAMSLKTVKQLLGIDINHIVNVDFDGFYEAVNAIDCVYVDVDRHYYHSNEGLPPSEWYDEIDIPAGYAKLCGYRALDYVRYRHNDNDIVRGARQQDFVREARQRIPPRKLLPYFGGDELIEIFTKHTSSDIDDVPTIVEMMKTFVEVRNAPVRQVELESAIAGDYVVATKDQVQEAVDQFLGEDLEEEPVAPAPESEEPRKKPDSQPQPPPEPEMIDVEGDAEQRAAEFATYMKRNRTRLPIFYPTRIVANSGTAITDESRSYPLLGPNDEEVFRGYKFVVSYQEEGFVSYYGLTGVSWTEPPILENPSEIREIDGREYMLFYDGDRLRLIGWKTQHGSYWVSNTLTRVLSEDELIAVATSARRFGG